jgi:hypothetical protein
MASYSDVNQNLNLNENTDTNAGTVLMSTLTSGVMGLLIIGLIIWTIIHNYRRYQKGQSQDCWCCCCWKECIEGDGIAKPGSAEYKKMNSKTDTKSPEVLTHSMFTGVHIV